MVTFAVEAIDAVTLNGGSSLAGMDLMSPFVWKEADTYRAMIRGVRDPLGPDDPTGVIALGTCHDGLAFAIDPLLAITPDMFETPDDAGGCEDPTVRVTEPASISSTTPALMPHAARVPCCSRAAVSSHASAQIA